MECNRVFRVTYVSILKYFIIISGLFFIVFFRGTPVRAENITLCYHRFSYSLDNPYSIPPELFEWQMRYIKEKKIKILTLNQFKSETKKSNPFKNDSILVTVDDGWKDFDHVLPFVKKEDIPVTLFLYPDVIRYRDFFSIDELNKLRKIKNITFGSHSFTHKLLINLDQATLGKEIIDSKNAIEDILKTGIYTFAYPHGRADKKAKELVSKNYMMAFRINPALNNDKTDRYNLNRFTVFKNTSFGEFINTVNQLKGKKSNAPYRIIIPEDKKDPEYKMRYSPFKIYKYPVEDKRATILVIPGSSLGPGWMSKTVDYFSKQDIETYLVVPRNNDIPFYRPDKALGVLKNWGLDEYTQDIRDVLRIMMKKKRKISILTWGDGFDMLMSASSETPEFRDLVKEIISINPSVLDNGMSNQPYEKKIAYYNGLLKKGTYSTVKSSEFLKIKTLSDMMILRPEGQSPFSKTLGYEKLTNRETLRKYLKEKDHPLLSLNYNSSEYSIDDLSDIYMQPVPLFNMAVPVTLIRDINKYWAEAMKKAKKEKIKTPGNCPVTFLYSESFEKNVKTATKVLDPGSGIEKIKLDSLSTIEIIMSQSARTIIMDRVR